MLMVLLHQFMDTALDYTLTDLMTGRCCECSALELQPQYYICVLFTTNHFVPVLTVLHLIVSGQIPK